MENQESLDVLCKQYFYAKQAEADFKKRRIALEEEIARRIATKDEGAEHVQTELFKVTITSKLTRALDEKEWDRIKQNVPDGMSPVRYKPELDLKKFRAIEAANPALFAMVSRAVSARPAKATVKVEQIMEEAAA